MANAGQILMWWLDPWMRVGSPLGARAGRILALSAALALTVLPAMMFRYGLDGWLWPLTGAVVVCAPAGIIVADQLTELFDRARRPKLSVVLESQFRAAGPAAATGFRLVVLFIGLSLGVFVGYSLMFVLPLLPADQMALLTKDYRRSMAILVGVFVVIGVAGSLLWYRTEAFRLQAAVDRARFSVLKQQMQPHFLFNSLNSLKELISENPSLAEEATQRIADLYRLLLKSSERATARLDEELTIVENYLEIEKIRYRERLRYELSAAPDLHALHVPSLVLQTLAENAVKHGVCKARAGGEVRVHATRRSDGWLELLVSNTGAPYAPPAPSNGANEGGGTGLTNTIARLDLMYGARSAFAITKDDTLGTCVRFAVSGTEVVQ